ncbi:purine and uridine phosphorylase [Aureobasidium pullulans]|uniref:Purine and uridine phosphorylase n=1 Tax=Aureobasidium pullulans TaxID=5580 RepID=A0A4T0B4I5_AURPU|nr:purine and uridine phosphorylase [Aureobasidium pullulans]
MSMSNPKDYTILWICALPLEYVAAQAFLDQEDPKSGVGEISNDDTNAYTLGQIAGHKVVLAVLPKGEIGVGSAASVIIHIIRSFPNIRIGLLVGVGGGAPTKDHDIRLGDIVVSSPKDGRSGIYHHDFGKETQETGFQQDGFLNQPPDVVRTAVAALEAKHTLKGHTINQSIEHAMIKNPRLKTRGFARPNPISDRLYKSDVLHSAIGESCTGCCENDPHNLVLRRQRGDDDDDPAIYYGLIGSGNKLIRNAHMRDKLAQDPGILCFEMEAAGIMNRMPCLVIRGICDYCDSHKNKDWQGYAAMTAAAYTTELLSEILPKHVEKVEVLANSLEELTSKINHINAAQTSEKIRRWLKAPDPSVNHKKALKAHHRGTGQWFLASNEFLHWKQESHSFLWLHGLSGCGKTVLSSTIIQHLLEETNFSTFYFYFDFSRQDQQEHEDMVRYLLDQVSDKSPKAEKAIEVLFGLNDKGKQQAGVTQMEEVLAAIFRQLDRVTIVLDALDESQKSDQIIGWCRDIFKSEGSMVRILVTSRTQAPLWLEENQVVPIRATEVDTDISSYVHGRLESDEFQHWKNQAALRRDVAEVLIRKANGMFRWAALQPDVLKQCQTKLAIRKALANLPRTLNDTYARMLTSIRAGEHFEEVTIILQLLVWSKAALPLDACQDAIIVCLEETPGFKSEDRFFDRPEQYGLVNMCSGLVAVARSADDTCDFLTLSHASVKDYLLSVETPEPFRDHLGEAVARLSTLRRCLVYLRCVDWEILGNDKHDDEESDFYQHNSYSIKKADELASKFPFAHWARDTWMEHAKALEDTNEEAQSLTLAFLRGHTLALERAMTFNISYFDLADVGQSYPLYLAACIGLEKACSQLIELDYVSDDARIAHENPTAASKDDLILHLGLCLIIASAAGHIGVVRKLLDSDANPTSDCNHCAYATTPLYEATLHHRVSVVELLLANGADVEHTSENSNCLQLASWRGLFDIVQILVNAGANIDCLGASNTPLALAAKSGHGDVVQFLLDKHANVNLTRENCPYGTALQSAAANGHIATAANLLEHGAHVNAFGRWGTALASAVRLPGNIEMVQMLLNNGAGVESQDGYGRTALQLAASCGSCDIMLELLERRADVNARGTSGTALTQAAKGGHIAAVEMLLARGADINAQGTDGTALTQAAMGGHTAAVEMLLECGAELDIEEGTAFTALQAAAFHGHKDVVQRLLISKADANASCSRGSVLSLAIAYCEEPALHYLSCYEIDKPLSVNMMEHGRFHTRSRNEVVFSFVTTLYSVDASTTWTKELYEEVGLAVEKNRNNIVQLLLENGANINGSDSCVSPTPLQMAILGGNTSLVKILLDAGADIQVPGEYLDLFHLEDEYHRRDLMRQLSTHEILVDQADPCELTVLQAAAYMGSCEIVRMLLDHGAHINTPSKSGCALSLAIIGEHQDIVALLLEKGAYVNGSDGYPTPLDCAVFSGCKSTVKLLIDHGARASARALTDAAWSGQTKLIKFLLGQHIDIRGDEEYTTPLHVAAMMGHRASVRLLLFHGADIDGTHEYGSALYAAASWHQVKIMEILISRGADVELAIEDAYSFGEPEVAQRIRQCQQSTFYADWQDEPWTHIFDETCAQTQPQDILTWQWQSSTHRVATQSQYPVLRQVFYHQHDQSQDINEVDRDWLELD